MKVIQVMKNDLGVLRCAGKVCVLLMCSFSLIFPFKQDAKSIIPSLDLKHWKWEWVKDFVRQSASWSADGIYRTLSAPRITWSQIKCTSISMCLVMAWKTGLVARAPALKLSHHKIGLVVLEIPSLESKCVSQIIYELAWANARYSNYVLERATALCFLDDHETKLLPANTQ